MTTAIIGGSGFSSLQQFKTLESLNIDTPYGKTSSDILKGELSGQTCLFLSRHGPQHSIAPHKINYRANIYALKQLNVKRIIALAAVGGIKKEYAPGTVCLPDQIIDYTYGREATFYDGVDMLAHAEFTEPYSKEMREVAMKVAKQLKLSLIENGTYAVTQGPRFETAAEIQRLKQDGAHIVGMTSMPECSLARELEISYMSLASSVNYAAGIVQLFNAQNNNIQNNRDQKNNDQKNSDQTDITMDEINKAMRVSSNTVYSLLPELLKAMSDLKTDTPALIKP